jgi:DNA-binding transcriptional ArsR family regulator
VPRAATTSDVFNAIAEPRRRRIVELLAGGDEKGVGDLVRLLSVPQPAVSNHQSELRRVRLVSVARRGRHRMYRLTARELKPVHDWVKNFERFWSHQIDRIKQRAEQKARERSQQQHEPGKEH